MCSTTCLYNCNTMSEYRAITKPVEAKELNNNQHLKLIEDVKLLLDITVPPLTDNTGKEVPVVFGMLNVALSDNPGTRYTFDKRNAFPGFKKNGDKWLVYRPNGENNEDVYYSMCDKLTDVFEKIETQKEILLYVASCIREECNDMGDLKFAKGARQGRHLHILIGANTMSRQNYGVALLSSTLRGISEKYAALSLIARGRSYTIVNPYLYLACVQSAGSLCSVLTSAPTHPLMYNVMEIQAEMFQKEGFSKKEFNYLWTVYSMSNITETTGNCIVPPFMEEGADCGSEYHSLTGRKRRYAMSYSDVMHSAKKSRTVLQLFTDAAERAGNMLSHVATTAANTGNEYQDSHHSTTSEEEVDNSEQEITDAELSDIALTHHEQYSKEQNAKKRQAWLVAAKLEQHNRYRARLNKD